MLAQTKKKILTRISLRNFRILFGNSKFPNIKNPPNPQKLSNQQMRSKKSSTKKMRMRNKNRNSSFRNFRIPREFRAGILVLGILY